MGLRVNTNVVALQSQRQLGQTTRESTDSFGKLSSGQRIVKAADDAAGLAISEKLKAHIRSGKQANRNANDGISLIQTAEGGLDQSTSILTRMRELATQAATDTLADTDRQNAGFEYDQLKRELERISQVTQFNGHRLLDGSGTSMDFHIGVGSAGREDIISFRASEFGSGVGALGVQASTILSKGSAQSALGQLDQAFNKISGYRSMLGSIQNRLQNSVSNLDTYHTNMSSSNSRIRDVDVAEETSKLAHNSIVTEAGTAVAAQANSAPKDVLRLF